MKDYFAEIIIIIAYSGRTQAAIFLGILGFIRINLIGDYYLSNFHLVSQSEVIKDIIKNKFASKYDKAAWGVLISFWWTAYAFYKKDKKKF